MDRVQQRIIKKIRNTKFLPTFPKFGIGTFLVTIFCAYLIVVATFTPIPLLIIAIPEEAILNPVEFFSRLTSIDQVTRVLNYIPQIPVVIMIASMLGPRTGLLSVFLYIIAGIFGFPIFAAGGGIDYFFRIGSGYILGFFIGTYLTGKILSVKINKLNIIKAAITGVIAIHLVGIVYLAIVLLLEQESFYAIIGWTVQLSGMQILYDFVFAIIAAFIGRAMRHALWITTD